MTIKVQEAGSIYVLYGADADGLAWLEENLDQGGQMWAGGYVVEHGYVMDILAGAVCDGVQLDCDVMGLAL